MGAKICLVVETSVQCRGHCLLTARQQVQATSPSRHLRGSLFLFFALAGLYVFVGIGVGIMLATVAKNQQQVVLISFFVNLPLIQLSGAIAPIESMPLVFKYLSLLNPLRHFVAIVRGILLKGVGLSILWPNVLALIAFVAVLLTISINRFRNQLS